MIVTRSQRQRVDQILVERIVQRLERGHESGDVVDSAADHGNVVGVVGVHSGMVRNPNEGWFGRVFLVLFVMMIVVVDRTLVEIGHHSGVHRHC